MAKEALKVVVRLLPPEITEEEFKTSVGEAHLQNTKWLSFQVGKRYKGEGAKASVNSRCYLQFVSAEAGEEFIQAYHGHQFVDGQGEQFRAVACIAPYQKVPRSKAQKDPRDGTIADDPLYKEFVEGLACKASFEAPPNPVLLLKPKDYGDTPLLNFIKVKVKERRARIERNKKKWRPDHDAIYEDPRAKWRCSECGTTRNLEEDPDDRGTFYCTYCWESWESAEAAAPKKKKKKKKYAEEEAEEEEEVEETATKKKKKKKHKEAEDEGKEWKVKDSKSSWSEYGYEEEGEGRRKKKKKSKGEDAGYEEESHSKWRVKGSSSWNEEYNEGEAWDKEKSKSKRRKDKKKEEEWWEEPADDRGKSGEKSEGSGRRWKAKSAKSDDWGGEKSEEKPERKAEEKPRRSRKDKGGGDDGDKWVPKLKP